MFLISSMWLLLLTRICQLSWTYISALSAHMTSSIPDTMSSLVFENSKVTFGSACIFVVVVVVYYFLIPLISVTDSVVCSFRFVESTL